MLAREAWRMAPDDDQVRTRTAWAMRRVIRPYHFPLVHDAPRVAGYERALHERITPDTVVLEIGAGSGLIALMAARAGAKHVYTCESESLVAAAARENIERNRLSDRVTVIAKRSTDLVIGTDLPSRANLLIHDLVADDVLAMDVLPVTEDARTH